MTLSWEEVLKRDDIVGGEIETQEDGAVYRGPISKIELRNGKVHFEASWMATMNPREGRWRNWKVYPFYVDPQLSSPQDIGNGRIQFNIPFIGLGVIFPKGGSKLDPAKVEGLQLTQV